MPTEFQFLPGPHFLYGKVHCILRYGLGDFCGEKKLTPWITHVTVFLWTCRDLLFKAESVASQNEKDHHLKNSILIGAVATCVFCTSKIHLLYILIGSVATCVFRTSKTHLIYILSGAVATCVFRNSKIYLISILIGAIATCVYCISKIHLISILIGAVATCVYLFLKISFYFYFDWRRCHVRFFAILSPGHAASESEASFLNKFSRQLRA
jgi:hypothetical protein